MENIQTLSLSAESIANIHKYTNADTNRRELDEEELQRLQRIFDDLVNKHKDIN